MEQKILNKSYVDFKGSWSPFPLDGFDKNCELPDNIDHLNLKQVGEFLQETYKFHISSYCTYSKKVFTTENGEELRGDKEQISDTFYFLEGDSVSSEVMRKYRDNEIQELEKEQKKYREKWEIINKERLSKKSLVNKVLSFIGR